MHSYNRALDRYLMYVRYCPSASGRMLADFPSTFVFV